MSLKDFRCIFLVACVVSSSLLAKEYTRIELLEIGRKALAQRANFQSKDEKNNAFNEELRGLSDEQKIKAVFYRAMESESDPKFAMSAYYSVLYGLNRDPKWVSDWSFLREVISKENDPRRFFILSRMIPGSTPEFKHDFVAERTHMLFADGRVAKEEGEYTKSYAHDVSAYAYKAIIGNLKALGADFEPPAKDLPHEEQAVILAKWLKGNWPGCENIEIPRRLLGEESRPRKSLTEQPKPSTSRIKERELGVSQEAKPQNEESRLPWIIAGVLLLGTLALLFKVIKGKATS